MIWNGNYLFLNVLIKTPLPRRTASETLAGGLKMFLRSGRKCWCASRCLRCHR